MLVTAARFPCFYVAGLPAGGAPFHFGRGRRDSKMESATEYQLKLLRWQFFGTVTWAAKTLGSVRSRETDLWEFFRNWAIRENTKLALLPIAVRWERGEIGGRPHAHFLMAGLPAQSVSENSKWRQQRLWEVHGIARIRLYDPFGDEGDAMSYLCKKSEHARRHVSNANRYELMKYSHADRLVITRAAWDEMCRVVGAENVPPLPTA
jgi:hypothetical protein